MTWWKKTPAPPPDARELDALWQEAFGHHQAGRIDQAVKLYRALLQHVPRHFDARHLLGVAALQQGRLDEAEREIAAALEIDPRDAAAHNNHGTVWLRRGDLARARASFEAALKLRAGDPEANANLAGVLVRLGEGRDAVPLLRKALAQRNSPDLHKQLAFALEQSGDAPAALKAYDRALALDAGDAEAASNRAALLARTGRLDEAVAALERLARDQPRSAHVHANLGAVQRDRGELDAACASLRTALKLDPQLAAARLTLATALFDLGDLDGSAREVDTLLRADARDAEAWVLRGRLAFARRDLAAATAALQQAVEIAPRLADAHHALGLVRMAGGDAPGARRSHERACELDPSHAQARWAAVMARLPAMPPDDDEAARSRQSFQAGLQELDRWFTKERAASGAAAVGSTQPFYIAYQRGNHRDLLQAYGRLCARLMQQGAGAPAAPARRSAGGKLRLGVVSAHFSDHSVWTAIVRGWLQRLDTGRIEVVPFDLRKTPAGLPQWVRRIGDAQPDVLLYPEIGMDAMTLRLAALRLAPRQVATWGHPMTTGLPTIDAFISADAMEPANAQEQYTEQLVRLPGLGVCYEPLAVREERLDLAALGLDPARPLLLCPGLPFKYAPRDDALWARIAARRPEAQLVFFASGPAASNEALRARLAHAFEARGLAFESHVRVLPMLPRAQFFALMRRATLFLDSVGFSGFNTAMQAVECRLPVVTLEGDALRGRFAAGILRELGLDDCIAADAASYEDIAARLVQDAAEREQVRSRMQSQRDRVFGTVAPVRALEAYLLGSM